MWQQALQDDTIDCWADLEKKFFWNPGLKGLTDATAQKLCGPAPILQTCPFPLNNLPYGVFLPERRTSRTAVWPPVIMFLDLAAAQSAGVSGSSRRRV